MVLIEISIECQEIGSRLLGEHRWSEMLRKPSDDEKERTTQIFYSIYHTLREAQKDGWKQISVLSRWFDDFRPINAIITHPYPPTHWCHVPHEDKTNKPICRPLPVKEKPPPPQPAPRPVVGSASWLQEKQAPPTNTPAALKGAWALKSKPVGASSTWNKPINEKPKQQSAREIRQKLWGDVNAGPKASNLVVEDDPIDALADEMRGATIVDNQAAAIDDVLYGDDEELDFGFGFDSSSVTADTASTAPTENLWDGIGETHVKPVEKINCPTHGTRCRGGICSDGAKIKREMRRRQEEAERAAARAARRKGGPDRGRRARDEGGSAAGSGTSSGAGSQVRQLSSSGGTESSEGNEERAADEWAKSKRTAKAPQRGHGRGRGRGRGNGNGNGNRDQAGTDANGTNGNVWAQPGAKSEWAAQGRKPRRG
ncbi:hypothetical protein HDZ31DRAFT_70273 [Schizophyllum fasciatum]